MIGFCVQKDILEATATVYETLCFAAALRLPATVSAAAREAHVREVMELVELSSLAGRAVGDTNSPGLSPGQLKRLSLGVELVSGPSILFLDEPSQSSGQKGSSVPAAACSS
jgi:ABC-type multidrug transport system ATPase subunit